MAADLLHYVSRAVRPVAQVGVIVTLTLAGVLFIERSDTQRSETTAINAVLAESCQAASFERLQRKGLVEECRLAQDGDLPEQIPDEDLPDPEAAPNDVPADLIADDDTSTPADIIRRPLGPTSATVERAVGDYFDSNPIIGEPGYLRAIERAVGAYLTENPPQRGRPPNDREIDGAVAAALVANPPDDGTDGRSVISTVQDRCDVVFTYSDGEQTRVGPVCGADGEPGPSPTDEQVAAAVVAYCQSNGECRGPSGPAGPAGPTGPSGPAGVVQTSDGCQPADGEVVTDVNIVGPSGEPATITIECATAPISLLGS